MRHRASPLLFVVLTVAVVKAWPDGAPPQACPDMMPHHNSSSQQPRHGEHIPPQSSEAPYSIDVKQLNPESPGYAAISGA